MHLWLNQKQIGKTNKSFLALNTSLFWEGYCLVRLYVVYRGRALPVGWRVLEHRSASVSFEKYQQMSQRALRRLPSGKRVVLLADCGFIHSDLVRMLTAELGWHYLCLCAGVVALNAGIARKSGS